MKVKKTDEQLIKYFWDAPDDAVFKSRTIELILDSADSTLRKYRVDGIGPKYIKLLNKTIVYRKRDVLEFLKEFEEK
jgi:hypothetical protein